MNEPMDTEILDWVEKNIYRILGSSIGDEKIRRIEWLNGKSILDSYGYDLRDCVTKAMEQENENI